MPLNIVTRPGTLTSTFPCPWIGSLWKHNTNQTRLSIKIRAAHQKPINGQNRKLQNEYLSPALLTDYTDNLVIHPKKNKLTAVHYWEQYSSSVSPEHGRLIDWIHPLESSSFHVTLEIISAVLMIYEQNFIKVFQLFLWVKNPIKLLSRLLRKDHDIRRRNRTIGENISSTSKCIYSHICICIFLNIKCHFLTNRHLKLNCNVMLWRIPSYLPI